MGLTLIALSAQGRTRK